ncbi:MAG: sulfotransferase domain-containing protein [Kangiellaceae bacterium]|nr:sulfotransferase domain-containing protein [Kangiellaceae bacterium]
MNIQSDKRYLIIAGESKSGTTSMYNYLKCHKDIATAKSKELRFFLDKSYPAMKENTFDGSNLDEYEEMFSDAEHDRIRLEASPDYMYCETFLSVAELLPNSKIIIIIRGVLDRIVSWYKFSLQKGLLEKNTSFEDYIELCIKKGFKDNSPIHLRALEQAKNKQFINKIKNAFSDRVFIVDFDLLRNNPQKLMADICKFTNISSSMYENYDFKISNKSVESRLPALAKTYDKFRRAAAITFKGIPIIGVLLSFVNNFVKKVIYTNRSAKAVIVNESTVAKIYQYIGQDYYDFN